MAAPWEDLPAQLLNGHTEENHSGKMPGGTKLRSLTRSDVRDSADIPQQDVDPLFLLFFKKITVVKNFEEQVNIQGLV